MKKRKKSIITALVITMTVGIGATAYAASDTAVVGQNTNPVHKALGMARITGMRGYEFVSNVLKDKLNLSDTDINQARDEGKTMYDLAKEKGMAEEDFKSAIVEEKSKAIDEAVSKEKLTKEQGDTIKNNIKTNIENCSGNFQGGRNSMNGAKDRGMGNGSGQGRGANCVIQNGN